MDFDDLGFILSVTLAIGGTLIVIGCVVLLGLR